MKNEYTLSEDGKTAYVKLTQGQVAIIDAEDLEKISEYRWCACWAKKISKHYVVGHKSGKQFYLHRIIMNAEKWQIVDHIDGDSLNNVKSNLRLCTASQNSCNMADQKGTKTGVRGVYKHRNKYRASITCNGETINLGSFDTIKEATEKRKEAEIKFHEEFIRKTNKVIHSRTKSKKRDFLPIECKTEKYGIICKVPLTRDQYAIISTEDYDVVSRHIWQAKFVKETNSFYAGSSMRSDNGIIYLLMHRLIMNADDGFVVDHINRDTLDNRRENLRIATNSENMRNRPASSLNTSGYKGVQKFGDKWKAVIQVNRKQIYLGSFITAEEAYEAYCSAALELHGEFACL